MSTLLLDELYDGVEAPQEFTIPRDMDLAHIRIWLYKHGSCTTDLTLEVYQGATLLATSTVTATEINDEIPATYFHGQVRFDFDPVLCLRVAEGNSEEEFRFVLSGSGGTLSNFVGIVRNWYDKFYETYGTDVVAGQAPNDFVEPFGFELFEYKYT